MKDNNHSNHDEISDLLRQHSGAVPPPPDQHEAMFLARLQRTQLQTRQSFKRRFISAAIAMAAGFAAMVHCNQRPLVHTSDDLLVAGILDDAAESVFPGGVGVADPGYLPADYTADDVD